MSKNKKPKLNTELNPELISDFQRMISNPGIWVIKERIFSSKTKTITLILSVENKLFLMAASREISPRYFLPKVKVISGPHGFEEKPIKLFIHEPLVFEYLS